MLYIFVPFIFIFISNFFIIIDVLIFLNFNDKKIPKKERTRRVTWMQNILFRFFQVKIFILISKQTNKKTKQKTWCAPQYKKIVLIFIDLKFKNIYLNF